MCGNIFVEVKTMAKKKAISVSIDIDLYEQLKHAADADRRSVSDYVRGLIIENQKRLEKGEEPEWES